MDVPETRYAKSGDLRIAYQVIGSGELDLVFIQGFVSNLDLCWEEPGRAYFLSRLASFSRLIVFDKRGTGLSDRTEGAPTLEERMDDLRAVMDAAGSSRTALFGFSEGGPMSLLFAASYPERVRAIGIYGSFARGSDLSGDLLRQRIEQNIARIERAWGTGEVAKNFAPNKARDPAYFPPPRSLGTPWRQPICCNQIDADEYGHRCAAYPFGHPGTDAGNAPARRYKRSD
jgi:pimeloyl-ACP methyl ester carboxylesterase